MPVSILYPRVGDPVRLASGQRAVVAEVERVDDDGRRVWLNVVFDERGGQCGVPSAWDAAGGEWVEVPYR